jgi:hypothetical protein
VHCHCGWAVGWTLRSRAIPNCYKYTCLHPRDLFWIGLSYRAISRVTERTRDPTYFFFIVSIRVFLLHVLTRLPFQRLWPRLAPLLPHRTTCRCLLTSILRQSSPRLSPPPPPIPLIAPTAQIREKRGGGRDRCTVIFPIRLWLLGVMMKRIVFTNLVFC